MGGGVTGVVAQSDGEQRTDRSYREYDGET